MRENCWRVALAIMTIAALTIAGCGSDSTTGSDNDGDVQTGGAFTISVSGGTTPTYSWDAGPAYSLTVVEANNPSVIAWALIPASVTSTISSPVQHGTVPSGAMATNDEGATLTEGTLYQLTITLSSGSSAYAVFTP